MRNINRLLSLLLLLYTLLFTFVNAAKQPTSYCKCICFQNSTIIPLNSSPPSASVSPAKISRRDDDGDNNNTTEPKQQHHTLTCNDCNRAFCLDYNLPICRNAKEEDVFATCFQRDSLKDRTIVTLFLLATASLLGWALIKPFVVKTTDSISSNATGTIIGRYLPVRHQMTPSEDLGGLPRTNGRSNDPGDDSDGGRRLRTGGGSLSRQGGLNS